MLDKLAAIPDATVLPRNAQQSSATFTADVIFSFHAQRRGNAVGGIFGHVRRKFPDGLRA